VTKGENFNFKLPTSSYENRVDARRLSAKFKREVGNSSSKEIKL